MSKRKGVWQRNRAAQSRLKHAWKNKRLRRWLMVLVGGVLAAYLVFGDYGFYRRGRLVVQKRDLALVIEQEKAKRDSLFSLREKLLSDTAFMEKVAREKLGMAREDETVYRFIDTTRKNP